MNNISTFVIGFSLLPLLASAGESPSLAELIENELAEQEVAINKSAWRAFHESIDTHHKNKSKDWMDSDDRRKLLEVAFDEAIAKAIEQTRIAEKAKQSKLPPPKPMPDIPLNSTAWMTLDGEPRQVRIDRGPSEDRKYLIRVTRTYKVYGSDERTYARFVNEVGTERTKEVYMLVNEQMLYFPEKVK
ncbi:MAG: hypothetical protein KGI50_06900 [Patescibacteria group bacterium]|nr:hypothetical protein [Patescibacteria group bacterium]MDE2438820.1 hypothetical protein [Patescibacteria group bacterium]